MSFPDFVWLSEAVPPTWLSEAVPPTWLSEAVPAGPRASFRTRRHSVQQHKYNAGAGFPTPALPAKGLDVTACRTRNPKLRCLPVPSDAVACSTGS